MHLPRLCRLLHYGRNLLGKDTGRRVLAIDLPVRLGSFACLGDEYSEVGAHARVDDADIWADDRNLVEHGRVDEDGR